MADVQVPALAQGARSPPPNNPFYAFGNQNPTPAGTADREPGHDRHLAGDGERQRAMRSASRGRRPATPATLTQALATNMDPINGTNAALQTTSPVLLYPGVLPVVTLGTGHDEHRRRSRSTIRRASRLRPPTRTRTDAWCRPLTPGRFRP